MVSDVMLSVSDAPVSSVGFSCGAVGAGAAGGVLSKVICAVTGAEGFPATSVEIVSTVTGPSSKPLKSASFPVKLQLPALSVVV